MEAEPLHTPVAATPSSAGGRLDAGPPRGTLRELPNGATVCFFSAPGRPLAVVLAEGGAHWVLRAADVVVTPERRSVVGENCRHIDNVHWPTL